MTRFENANGARSSPLLPSAVADACSLQAQLSDGNVSLKHTETRSKKAFSISSNGRAWANGSGARGAKKEADARFSLTWGAYIPPIWILRLGGTPPPSRDAPAGRPYRPGGGASEATWTRPRPFRNFNGPTSLSIGFEFKSLEYLSSEAGAHLS